jgi:hypothetical protein
VLAERWRRRNYAGAAVGEGERREWHAETTLHSGGGGVVVDDAAGRELRVGDKLSVHGPSYRQELTVLSLSLQRGSGTVARTMYAESAESLAAREQALQQRRLAPEPAASLQQGRPTKRDRRSLAEWHRWSASAEE